MKRNRSMVLFFAAILSLAGTSAWAQSSSITLLGSGATFPAPVYTKMFDVYAQATGVKVNYQAIGSSGGLKNIKDRVVDFGGSDSFVKDGDMASYPGQIVHIPTVVGAVVITYNLPGAPAVRLTGEVIANIYLGKIGKWNDSAIAALNPTVKLPNLAIMPVYRSDGSGTTFNFTAYLSDVSADWKTNVGNANSVSWPAGQGAAQNAGVAGAVKQTPGSIGYVELAYANQNKLAVAEIKNASGKWIEPTLESISAAAAGAIAADTRTLIVNTAAPDGYPISAMTWIIVYRDQKYGNKTQAQAKAMVDLLWWVLHDGQKYANPLDYATLPKATLAAAEKIVRDINYGGSALLK
jgi:phosphate transport system substrate-binding protein